MECKDILLGRKNVDRVILTCSELQRTEKVIVHHVQWQFYTSEISLLSSSQKIKRNSSRVRLHPIPLRVGRRLQISELSFEEEHPIILPNKCHVTTLIIRHFHERVGHMGRAQVMSVVRKTFWIINANSVVRGVLGNCITCREMKSLPNDQKMLNLPKERLCCDEPPFTYVGADYFGPFYTKRGRAQLKRYGVIFTCLVIREVHLEVAEDLSTSAFMVNFYKRTHPETDTEKYIF